MARYLIVLITTILVCGCFGVLIGELHAAFHLRKERTR